VLLVSIENKLMTIAIRPELEIDYGLSEAASTDDSAEHIPAEWLTVPWAYYVISFVS
jgi:hypothetical protein